jgi:predicted ArsR family transcriptional regulator
MESGESVESLEGAALSWGRQMGREARERAGIDAAPAAVLRQALDALTEAGFDPRPEPDGRILLHRCPFEASKSDAAVRICHMNLALCRGLVEGLAAPRWSVRLEPQPGRCCTVFQAG